MTKLEVGKEYWFKGRVTEIEEMYRHTQYRVKFEGHDLWMPFHIEDVAAEAIQGREKVTIPKEVAEWIVSCKEYEYDLNDALDDGINDNTKEVQDWLILPENQDTFARAWLDGYEIEKEPLYTVELPNPNRKGNNLIYLGKADNTGKVFINKGTFNPKNKNLWLTESEIKKDFEWAWQFAKPVEELDAE